MEYKLKVAYKEVCSRVEDFIVKNNIDISTEKRAEKKAYIMLYASEFDLTERTAKEHFKKYEDFIFIKNENN